MCTVVDCVNSCYFFRPVRIYRRVAKVRIVLVEFCSGNRDTVCTFIEFIWHLCTCICLSDL